MKLNENQEYEVTLQTRSDSKYAVHASSPEEAAAKLKAWATSIRVRIEDLPDDGTIPDFNEDVLTAPRISKQHHAVTAVDRLINGELIREWETPKGRRKSRKSKAAQPQEDRLAALWAD